ncbi:MAG: aminoglycoside phosphotransferase family protein, partial [Massilia sp.]|nr:aminoglycoside phosphotransferase family protein [Massilia sp.]
DAFDALTVACREAGLASEGAELVRLGENAIYRLAKEQVIVRIARGEEVLRDAEKEVAVASWLRDEGLPAAEPTDHRQPILAQGRPVTFWRLIPDSGEKASLADLGRILRRLHSLPVPKDLPLPEFNIFGRASQRIEKTAELSHEERGFLVSRLAELRDAYATLKFPLQPCAIHADAHQSNLIQTPDGSVLLIDFEGFAFGPPEYDLSVTATEHLVGWHTDTQYAAFVESYGFDVKDWSGFPVVRAINELKMTTWLMQNVGEGDHIATEFRIRLTSLYDNEAPRPWSPF